MNVHLLKSIAMPSYGTVFLIFIAELFFMRPINSANSGKTSSANIPTRYTYIRTASYAEMSPLSRRLKM